MEYKRIGQATIGKDITPIRKYDNGYYVVEVNYVVKYSADNIDTLKEKLDADGIKYSFDGGE